MKPNIEITAPHLKEVSALLNALLADEYVLYTKTRSAHWNVQGMNFIQLHAFFQTQYEALEVIIDDAAERIRSLGHFPLGSLKGFIKVTHLTENDGSTNFSDQKEIIQALIDDHEGIIRIIRKDIVPITDKYEDLGTTDFVTGLMEQHEKMAWMLRAHLS